MRNPFIVNLIGKSFSVDGGENNIRGPEGVEGQYETFEKALTRGLKVLSEHSILEIKDWNLDNEVIFRLDGSFKSHFISK